MIDMSVSLCGVRFKNPYIKDIAEYDYLEIPIYNANDYDIQMKCWWSNHVLLKKGEWTKVILSASVCPCRTIRALLLGIRENSLSRSSTETAVPFRQIVPFISVP